uniref:Uncharacterized protein n=1 Tax=Oryza brachyantha TaxID=4533 RepID=J3NCE5_ORYBR
MFSASGKLTYPCLIERGLRVLFNNESMVFGLVKLYCIGMCPTGCSGRRHVVIVIFVFCNPPYSGMI